MALAYRDLFALLPFTVFLVTVLSFLRLDAVLLWLAEQGPPGLRGPLPNLIEWLEDGILGQTQGGILAVGIVLAFWSVSMGARVLTKALNALFEVEETRPAWKRVAASLTFAPALALAVIAAVGLILVTSRAMAWISSWAGLDAVFVLLWGLLRIPVALPRGVGHLPLRPQQAPHVALHGARCAPRCGAAGAEVNAAMLREPSGDEGSPPRASKHVSGS